jgi:hypothetical protein
MMDKVATDVLLVCLTFRLCLPLFISTAIHQHTGQRSYNHPHQHDICAESICDKVIGTWMLSVTALPERLVIRAWFVLRIMALGICFAPKVQVLNDRSFLAVMLRELHAA